MTRTKSRSGITCSRYLNHYSDSNVAGAPYPQPIRAQGGRQVGSSRVQVKSLLLSAPLSPPSQGLMGWDPAAEPLENKERRCGPRGHEGKKREENRKSLFIVKEYTVKIV
ncbi:unnamed protein product [Arctogadus glacialis]